MSLKGRVATGVASMVARTVGLGGERFAALVRAQLARRKRPSSRMKGHTIRIHAPEFVKPDPADRALVERIFAAFRRAKEQQRAVDRRFLPASLWQAQLDRAYRPLGESLARNDAAPFAHFLANFGAWPEYTGIEHTVLVREYAADADGRRAFERWLMPAVLEPWLELEAHGRPLSVLSSQTHGNQTGSMIDGQFVSLSSAFDDVYARQVARWIDGERPVIAELGGGYGKFFQFIAQHLRAGHRYVAFDLPETLCCASYYLMKCFPEKKFLLFGEGSIDAATIAKHDFVLMPSFEIGALPDRSVDFFINRSSLGEMAPETARLFVREIGRTSNAFWHMNHESMRNPLEGGEVTLVNLEYPIDDSAFRLEARYIDAWSPVFRVAPEGWETYWYLYRRRT